jgi:hypothetical protein
MPQFKALAVMSALLAMLWWRATGSEGGGLVTIVAVLGTVVPLFIAYQIADPRPLARFNESGVHFTGGGRASLGRSRSYRWDQVKDVSPIRSQYPEGFEGLNLVPKFQIRAGQRVAGDAFWVRTTDGRRFKVASLGPGASLVAFRKALVLAREKGRGPTTSTGG